MFLNESSAERIETGSRPSTSSCMGARNLFSVKRHPPPRRGRGRTRSRREKGPQANERKRAQSVTRAIHFLHAPLYSWKEGRRERIMTRKSFQGPILKPGLEAILAGSILLSETEGLFSRLFCIAISYLSYKLSMPQI